MQDSKTYDAWVAWLFEQFPSYQNLGASAYKPGLTATLKLLEFVGNPHEKLKFIHVAGTNGKGSTCAITASLLQNRSYKVGLFTSPHLVDFRERIRINGQVVSKQYVVDFCEKLKSTDLGFSPSFFELSLAMALGFFAENACDWVVLETGMGGRLDATNVVIPRLSIITKIALDHQMFLGDTLEKIALEKAGIIKPKVPVFLAEKNPEILNLLKEVCKKRGCTYQSNERANTPDYKVSPAYQIDNISTAVGALSLLGFSFTLEEVHLAWEQIFVNTGFLGRMQPSQKFPHSFYDVSHNEDGLKTTFADEVFSAYTKVHVIYGASNDKDIPQLLDLTQRHMEWSFCSFSNLRSKTQKDFEAIEPKQQGNIPYFEDVNLAIQETLKNRGEHEAILVIGSFFLISDCEEIIETMGRHLNQ